MLRLNSRLHLRGLGNTKTFPSVIPTEAGATQEQREWRDPDTLSRTMPL